MSEKERTGVRDLLYSRWHRTESLRRFVAQREAYEVSMIDIDDFEYCRRCYQPLALIEVKHHNARTKVGRATASLAKSAGVEAYLVEYWPTSDGNDIEQFRLRDLLANEASILLTPSEYAVWLCSLRLAHACERAS